MTHMTHANISRTHNIQSYIYTSRAYYTQHNSLYTNHEREEC